jgi:hypothetical protein
MQICNRGFKGALFLSELENSNKSLTMIDAQNKGENKSPHAVDGSRFVIFSISLEGGLQRVSNRMQLFKIHKIRQEK